MRKLAHPVAAFIVTVLAVIGVGVGVLAATGSGGLSPYAGSHPSTNGYGPLAPTAPFCLVATQWVGTYSVNVMWTLGLNDGRALPTHMTPGIESVVVTMASKTNRLAQLAPTRQLASSLRTLAKQLVHSTFPSGIVRAEAEFGAVSFVNVARACSSPMMLMSTNNPLGDYGKYWLHPATG